MKPYLFFLGSGASVPFGLPTMRQMVNEFEESLEKYSPVQKLYDLVKIILETAYGYVDIESIFSVIDIIIRDVRYIDYGFASVHKLAMVGVTSLKEKAFHRSEVERANELARLMKEFVRERCKLGDSAEVDDKINRLYGRVFEAFCNKYSIGKTVQSGKSSFFDPQCPIFTTNYDLVVEQYFQGRSYINDLWKDENNIKTLDVEKIEAGPTTLIKLHGSLNWFQLGDGTVVNLDSAKNRFGSQNVKGEVMLYPIRQKDLYLYPWFNLFYRLKKDLSDTNNWIVLGYSFNDEFIRNTFAEIIKNPAHKMLVIGPSSKDIVNEHFGSNDRIIPIEGKFEDADITSKVLQHL